MTSRQAAILAATALIATPLLAGCGASTGSPTPLQSGAAPAPSADAGTAAPDETPVSGSFDPSAVRLELQLVAEVPGSPLAIAAPADGSGRLFVADQDGRIWIVRDGQVLETPFLDIAASVTAGGEQGLLGLAFHPSYPGDPRFFVYYTDRARQQVVAQWRVSAEDPDRADPESESVLLQMADFAANHNGGGLAFGPDGFLHISTGDGGGGGDPQGNGQKLGTLLGKILRIDIGQGAAGRPYSIPLDNPFRETAGALPEIFVTGLRNPWRISFDRGTGDLWIGDVGQGSFEEIDVVRAGSGGGQNFGWNLTEGFHCYPADPCETEGLTPPVTEYDHSLGCSVTGGVVYRGSAQPALVGGYVFADYCSGNVWLIDSAETEVRVPRRVAETDHLISSFGEDELGEVFATDLNGQLLRVVGPTP